MPERRLRLTEAAVADIARLRAFLRVKSPDAAERAGQIIARGLSSITQFPESGRPVDAIPGGRELLIEFGVSGYVALYVVTDKHVVVLAVRHQREAGCQEER